VPRFDSYSDPPERSIHITGIRTLLHQIASPAVAVSPEWAVRAHLSFGVVDPFLVGATYDLIGHDNRLGAVIPHELEDLGCNSQICPDVALLGNPTLE
jgi:hypothetical protein